MPFTHNETEIVPIKGGYVPLTVGELRAALEGLDPNLPVHTGYYQVYGVSLMVEQPSGFTFVDLHNNE